MKGPAYIQALGLILASSTLTVAQDPQPASPTPQIVVRGQDFAVYGHITSAIDDAGNTVLSTNRSFTLLENALRYRV